MSDAMTPEMLADATSQLFAEVTRDRWLASVDGVVRKSGAIDPEAALGAGEAALTATLADGIEVRPLYTSADVAPGGGWPGSPPFTPGAASLDRVTSGWDVRQLHDDPDAARTRKAVLDDLESGATSVWLRLGAGGIDIDDLGAVLADVHLEMAAVVLDAGPDVARAADAYARVVADRKVAPATLTGSLGADPIGVVARHGGSPDLAGAAQLAAQGRVTSPLLAGFTVDGLAYHEAGCTDAQEIALVTAAGLEYLRALDDAGVAPDDAAALLEFRLAASADQFAVIAKLRAARRVWSRVAEVCGVSDGLRGQRQHAVTSWSMLTQRDPWVNILRTSTACFAAGVGGADAVTVLPFDAAIGISDEFSRRLARNTQAIIVEESHVARVLDPAGGSWYVEVLTDELARSAWAALQEVEAAGGMARAVADGTVARMVGAARSAHADRVARRREPITGVSEFPNLGEASVERIARSSADVDDGRVRWAAMFESLRDRVDAFTARAGARPVLRITLPDDADRATKALKGLAAATFATAGIAPGAGDVVIACVADGATDDAPAAARVRLLTQASDTAEDNRLHPGADAVAVITRALDEAGIR